MLRIEEIVGAMDDEFRYALGALDDERLSALKANQAALRRMRPVGVSNAEAMAMIDAIQHQRARKIEQDAEAERKRLERAAKRKAAPRKKKPVVNAPMPEPEVQPVTGPESPELLAPKLPEPEILVQAPPPGPPEPLPVAEPPPAQGRRGRLLLVIIPVLLTVLVLLAG